MSRSGSSSRMASTNTNPLPKKPINKGLHCYNFLSAVILFSIAFLTGSKIATPQCKESPRLGLLESHEEILSHTYMVPRKPFGSELLPNGIISKTSDMEMHSLWGPVKKKQNEEASKNLLALPVGIRQKEAVNNIVYKFLSSNFTIMLFHYDGVVDKWKDFDWVDRVTHVSAVNQTKWWFAKRFLHPDIMFEYSYIFLWDEDLDIENFHPERYLAIIQEEGLTISQPALDPSKSEVHHQITIRSRRTKVHRRIYKFSGRMRCYKNSTSPPCTGWIEIMAPVFSKAAWHCVWHLIQNDLIHGWGLDMKLGYCAQGDRRQKVGVVDAEYVVHKGIPSLGGHSGKIQVNAKESHASQMKHPCNTARCRIRARSTAELNTFNRRWQQAVEEDKFWKDPF